MAPPCGVVRSTSSVVALTCKREQNQPKFAVRKTGSLGFSKCLNEVGSAWTLGLAKRTLTITDQVITNLFQSS